MADFAARISDADAAERLSDTLRGRGAFRRFKDQPHVRCPELVTPWHAFADNRARNRAVGWLLEHGFTDQATADAYFEQHPDPALP